MHDTSDPEHLRRQFEEKQSATTFPETLRAGRSVDEFLWKGDPKATPVQRVGLFIFASMFLIPSFGFFVLVFFEHDWLIVLIELAMGALSGFGGLRLLSNAFRHRKRHQTER